MPGPWTGLDDQACRVDAAAADERDDKYAGMDAQISPAPGSGLGLAQASIRRHGFRLHGFWHFALSVSLMQIAVRQTDWKVGIRPWTGLEDQDCRIDAAFFGHHAGESSWQQREALRERYGDFSTDHSTGMQPAADSPCAGQTRYDDAVWWEMVQKPKRSAPQCCALRVRQWVHAGSRCRGGCVNFACHLAVVWHRSGCFNHLVGVRVGQAAVPGPFVDREGQDGRFDEALLGNQTAEDYWQHLEFVPEFADDVPATGEQFSIRAGVPDWASAAQDPLGLDSADALDVDAVAEQQAWVADELSLQELHLHEDVDWALTGDCESQLAEVEAVMGSPLQSHSFMSTRKFTGAVPGFVYKTGEQGTGYYSDLRSCSGDATSPFEGPSSESAVLEYLMAAQRQSGCICISLETLLVREDSCQIPRSRAQRRCARTRKRAKHGSRRATGVPWKPTAEVSKRDSSHRAAGVWAFDSYNGNAMSTAQTYLEQCAADVCLVQESRVAGDQLRAAERAAKRSRWNLALEPALHTEAGGLSAGTGVAVRNHFGHSCVLSDFRQPCIDTRLKVSWLRAYCKGGLFCLSACFWHSEGLSQRNLDLLEGIAKVIQRLHGPWLLAADFNFPPEVLRKSGWLRLVGGVVHASNQSTCNEQEYDYFVVDSRLNRAVLGVAIVIDTGAKPHSAVRLWLQGKPRSHSVRVLAHPAKVSASPPQGCLPRNSTLGFEGIAQTADADQAEVKDLDSS